MSQHTMRNAGGMWPIPHALDARRQLHTVPSSGSVPAYADGPQPPRPGWSREPNRLGNVVDVGSFGAIGDGRTDCSTAIAAAVAAVNAQRAEVPVQLTFPAGRYLIRSDLPLISHGDVVILGHGAILDFGVGCTAGLQIHDPRGPLSNIQVRGLHLVATTPHVQVALKMLDVRFVVMEGLTISGFEAGITVATYQYPMIANCNIDLCGIGIEVNYGDGLEIVNCRLNGTYGEIAARSKGIALTRCLGTLVSQTDITRFALGIAMDPAGTTQSDPWNYVSFTFLNAVLADSCTHGLHVDARARGCVQGLFAANCWFSTNNGLGISMSNCSGANFSSCVVFNNGDWGGSFDNCYNVQLTGCTIAHNNRLDLPGAGGLVFRDCDGVTVSGGIFTNDDCADGWKPALHHQRLGLRFLNGLNDVQVTSNRFVGHDRDIEMPARMPARGMCRHNITSNEPSVPSAREVAPDLVHDVVHVTGSTRIDNILTPIFPNKELTLTLDEPCTIANGLNFALAGDFAGTAGSTLVLRGNPVTGKWGEVSRAIVER